MLGCANLFAQPPEPTPSSVPVESARSLLPKDGLGDWEPLKFGGEGKVAVKDGVLTLNVGESITGVRYTGVVPKNDYEISWQAKRTTGVDFSPR